MNFNLKEAVEILERTPQTLEVFCAGLSEGWLAGHEGAGTWNVTEVIEHLIEAEKSNWMPRLESILKEGEGKPFPPFDRFAHIHDKPQGSIGQKLHLFKSERMRNLDRLKELVESVAASGTGRAASRIRRGQAARAAVDLGRS